MENERGEIHLLGKAAQHGDTELFPASRVTKILKTDPDVRKVSSEAVRNINVATVIFLRRLTCQSNSLRAGRKTLTIDDVVSAIRLGGTQFKFLQSNVEVLRETDFAVSSKSLAEDDTIDEPDTQTRKVDKVHVEAKFSKKKLGRSAVKSADITTFFNRA